jgi:hypothetical protein
MTFGSVRLLLQRGIPSHEPRNVTDIEKNEGEHLAMHRGRHVERLRGGLRWWRIGTFG